MLKRLGSYPRQNGLALALREIGRIERTLFTLDWLEDPSLRPQATGACQSVGDPGQSATAADRPASPASTLPGTSMRVQLQIRILVGDGSVIVSYALACSHSEARH